MLFREFREIHTGSPLRFSFRFKVLRMAFLLHLVTMPVGRDVREPQESVVEKADRMTCKIERLARKGDMIVLGLFGLIQLDNVNNIKTLIEPETRKLALDLV